MKHKLIKLISVVLILGLFTQQLAWAHPDGFGSLRAMALAERTEKNTIAPIILGSAGVTLAGVFGASIWSHGLASVPILLNAIWSVSYSMYYIVCTLIGHSIGSYADQKKHWTRFMAASIVAIMYSFAVPWYAGLIKAHVPDLGIWTHSLRPLADLFIFSQIFGSITFMIMGLFERLKDTFGKENIFSKSWFKGTWSHIQKKIKLFYEKEGFYKLAILFWMPIVHFMYYDMDLVAQIGISASIIPFYALLSAIFTVQRPGENLTKYPKLDWVLKRCFAPAGILIGMGIGVGVGGPGLLTNIASDLLTTLVAFGVAIGWTRLVRHLFSRFAKKPSEPVSQPEAPEKTAQETPSDAKPPIWWPLSSEPDFTNPGAVLDRVDRLSEAAASTPDPKEKSNCMFEAWRLVRGVLTVDPHNVRAWDFVRSRTMKAEQANRIKVAILDWDETVSLTSMGYEGVTVPKLAAIMMGRPLDPIQDAEALRTIRETAADEGWSNSTTSAIDTLVDEGRLDREAVAAAADHMDEVKGATAMELVAWAVRVGKENGNLKFVNASEEQDFISQQATFATSEVEDLSNPDSLKSLRLKKGFDEITVKGAITSIEMLRVRGVKVYIVSGAKESAVREEVARFGLRKSITGIYGDMGLQKNTKEYAIAEIIYREENNIDHPAEILVVGDGAKEIGIGGSIGATTVGVAPQYKPGLGERLKTAGAKIIVEDFSDPEALFDQIQVPLAGYDQAKARELIEEAI